METNLRGKTAIVSAAQAVTFLASMLARFVPGQALFIDSSAWMH
jgi:hypothetical protein